MRDKLLYNIRSKGFTQKQFAEMVGISGMYMSLIINGKKKPSRYITLRIAKLLEMTPEDVLSVEEIA